MTSFVAWVGADSRGPASLYLASDSRISWGAGSTWDHGRKLFASTRHPDLLGYVGDVLFPSLVLSQLISAINAGALYKIGAMPDERFCCIRDTIRDSFNHLPSSARHTFTIVYGTREGEGIGARFSLWILVWNPVRGWAESTFPLPIRSSSLWVSGSGEDAIQQWQSRWNSSSQGGTSRAVFSAFCSAISSGSDPNSGGAPQLVGLYRKGPARTIGTVAYGTAYLFGMPLPHAVQAQTSEIEWRNVTFERCDATGKRLPDAQRHYTPRGLAHGNARRLK
jgi:hypothetical protein